jgi:FIMAH domain
VLLAASDARALPSNCTQSLTTVTCTFSPTGSEQTFVVPGGVSGIHVVATGASGGTTFIGQGGAGAQVASDLAVTPGATLFVEVNVGGGPSLGSGAPGGGESDVRTCSVSASCGTLGTAQDPRLIVAGGGGGGGLGGGAGNGGNAGSMPGGTCTAGADGTAGNLAGGSDGPGLGGGCAAGGAGGIGGANGTAGVAGIGGTGGGGNGGGGGGAGYFGGGGGAGSDGLSGSGGGGGGGSSFGPAGSVFAAASTGPSVVISYTAPPVEEAIADLKDTVSGFGLPKGLTTALNAKLNAALAALDADDTAGACDSLQAFLNQVKAQTGKKLSSPQAHELTDAADDIRTQLDC